MRVKGLGTSEGHYQPEARGSPRGEKCGLVTLGYGGRVSPLVISKGFTGRRLSACGR